MATQKIILGNVIGPKGQDGKDGNSFSLSSSITSESEVVAATSKAVKTAYDLADSKLKGGDGGLYSKSPLLNAGTSLVASEVICVNQSFTLEGSYQYTPDDSRPWYGILNINRRLYDNNLAVVLTLYDGNKTYQRAGGDRGNGSWEWYDWKEDVTTDNIFNYQTGIGVGQKWHNVMSGRAWGVVYTNTTEKPIVVSLGMTSDSGDSVAVLYVDNIIVSVNTLYKQWSNAAQLSAIVPAGSIYYATQSNVNRRLQYWVELR